MSDFDNLCSSIDSLLQLAFGERIEKFAAHLGAARHTSEVEVDLHRLLGAKHLFPALSLEQKRIFQFLVVFERIRGAILLVENTEDIFREESIPINTTEVMVATGSDNLDSATVHVDDGNIESTTTEVIDEHGFGFGRFHAIRDSGSSRLIDDTNHIETGDFACLLGLETLLSTEISGASDNDILDRLGVVAEVVGVFDEFFEDECRDF